MCEIGKPLEIVDSKPLSLPAPLRREKETWAEQTVTADVPALETTVDPTMVEL